MRKEVIEIEVNVNGQNEVNVLRDNIKEVRKDTDETTKTSDRYNGSIRKSGYLVQELNKHTGGLASSSLDVFEGFKKTNGAIKLTRAALISTGIGAIVVAAGLIFAYWDNIVEFIGGANKKLQTQIDLKTRLIDGLSDELTLLKKTGALLEAQGVTAIENKKQQREKAVLLAAENILLQQQLEKQLLIEETDARKLTFLQKTINLINLSRGLPMTEFVGTTTDEEQSKIDEISKKVQKAKEDTLDLAKFIADLDKPEKEKKEKVGKKEEFRNALGYTESEWNKLLSDAKDLQKLKDDLLEADLERQRLGNEAIKEIEDEKFANDMQREDQRLEILQRNSDAAKKIAQLEAQAKNEALQLYANGLATISDLVGKETGAGKALSVASTLISTYLSAQKAYESQLSIPTPDAPIRAALAAGIAVASGLANVKAILSVKVPNSGASQGVAAGATQAQAPQFNVVGSSGTNQLASAIGGQSQKPIKTYVVANEVVTQAAMDRNIVNAATFGG